MLKCMVFYHLNCMYSKIKSRVVYLMMTRPAKKIRNELRTKVFTDESCEAYNEHRLLSYLTLLCR